MEPNVEKTGREWVVLLRSKIDLVAQILWNGERFEDASAIRITVAELEGTALSGYGNQTVSITTITEYHDKLGYRGMTAAVAAQLILQRI